MISLARVMSHSLASTATPELTYKREVDIRGLSNPAKRLGALGLHRFVIENPGISKRIINMALKHDGLEYLGGGAETVVLGRGDSVLKVFRESTDMDESAKSRFADSIDSLYQQSTSYFGKLLIDQSVFIDSNPLHPERQSVQLVQPLFNYDATGNIFNYNDPCVDVDVLRQLTAGLPYAHQELATFVDDSLSMHNETGFLPDTNGPSNIAFGSTPNSDTHLMIVDTQPITPLPTPVHEMVMRQLHSLAGFLSAA